MRTKEIKEISVRNHKLRQAFFKTGAGAHLKPLKSRRTALKVALKKEAKTSGLFLS